MYKATIYWREKNRKDKAHSCFENVKEFNKVILISIGPDPLGISI